MGFFLKLTPLSERIRYMLIWMPFLAKEEMFQIVLLPFITLNGSSLVSIVLQMVLFLRL